MNDGTVAMTAKAKATLTTLGGFLGSDLKI